MAITRAQQAKQLLAQGGRTGFFLGGGSTTSAKSYDSGAVSKTTTAQKAARDDGPSRSRIQDEKQQEFVRNEIKNLVNKQQEEKAFEPFETLIIGDTRVPSYIPGSTIINTGLGATKKFRQKTLDRNLDFYRFDPRTEKAREKYGLTAQGYKDYMNARLSGEIDAAGNVIPDTLRGDRDEPILLPDATGIMSQASETTDQGTDDEDEGLRLAFRADGGPVGGIMDFESGRQMYFLGKLVKKATRAVKKIAKSPIGKAALLGATAFGIPGTSIGGLLGRASFGGAAQGLFGTFGPTSALQKLGIMKSVSDAGVAASRTGPLAKFFGSPLSMIGAASVVAGALTPAQEKQARELADNTGFSIEEARNAILQAAKENYAMDVRARGFKADGGLMRLGYQEGGDAEPVAKKTMPLLDMGGKEKDYRETGGFVDMGRMERADDVPARLSKNEFVFTADAVRNAGDGNIDKGAEVMYNMMKNLEAGGEVSEESQGLKGARRMFQTSQRLEEVL